MRKEILLLILTATASALCWWPVILQPSIDLPLLIPIAILAVIIGLATALSEKRRAGLAVAATAGSFAGSCVGFLVLPFTDDIGHTYWPIATFAITLVAVVVSTIMILAVRKITVSSEVVRRLLWLALAGCIAFGPFALALTPTIVSHRTSRNERIAAERVKALKTAVQQSMAENGDPGSFCDGQVLKHRYVGPSFSESDWGLITRSYVRQDGYAFMIFCPEQGGYRISAIPQRVKADGTRNFCADESGKAGCTKDQSF